MEKATISTIVSQLEKATQDLKAFQAKIRELRTATQEMQHLGTSVREAIERRDVVWLMNWEQRLREIGQRCQVAEAELADLLT